MRIGSLHLSLALAATALVGGLASVLSFTMTTPSPPAAVAPYYAYHEHVIGTSLELWMNAADEATAKAAEDAILDEIARLRRVFSLYESGSELCRLNRTREPLVVSPDMIEVLNLYTTWQAHSRGAFSGQVGALVDVWKKAEKEQREPDHATLSRIAHQIRQPGWSINAETSTVTRLSDQPLNLNAIAKGYIIQKAAAAAYAAAPGLKGLLINLGGDIAVRGRDAGDRSGWLVGVQNPLEPYDNARPLARLRLADRAVATSGGYERFYTIQGQRFSHLFDPRTGRPAVAAASATVIAADNATANALATTLCVLSPAEGLALIASVPQAECLIVTEDGTQHRSAGFAQVEQPDAPGEQPVFALQEAKKWPAGFEVKVSVMLPEVPSKKYRRPYVAVWVENADAKPVRTITEWGNNPRWIKDLPQWWAFAKSDPALVKAVSRATRPPGKHNLVWDGMDDKGKPLAQGMYTIHVEVHREHGKLVRQTGRIECGPTATRITLEKNAETGETLVEYAKKKAP